MNNLHVAALTKTYSGGIRAISNLSFSIPNGIVALLGPNGAGKTTLLRTLATVLNPSSGSISLNGINPAQNLKQYRKQIGYLPQHFGLYPSLNPYEHLLLFSRKAKAADKQRAIFLLEQTGLTDVAHIPTSKLSGGMKQRLGIAISLVNNPKLLILDEPSTGLDPQERIRFRILIEKIARQSIVIISTHIVQDIELGCSRVILINNGAITQSASPETFISLAKNNTFSLTTSREHSEQIKRSRKVTAIKELENGLVKIKFVGNALNEGEVLSSPSLEDAYIFLLSINR